MNTLLETLGLCPLSELTKAMGANDYLQSERESLKKQIAELAENNKALFATNESLEANNQSLIAENKRLLEQNNGLLESVENLTDKLDKKNYFANIRKMGNMKQQITRLTAELNALRNK